MTSTYFILVGLCFIGVAIRAVYEHQKELGKVDLENKLLFWAIFMAMGMFLFTWPFFTGMDPLQISLPVWLRYSGLTILILGVLLSVGGVLQLRGLENIDHLVTTGIYSKIRHPMYAGFILWISGWILFNGALLSVLAGIICIWNVLHWRHLEEINLVSSYGDVYLKYAKTTLF